MNEDLTSRPYRVTIYYREPTYEQTVSPKANAYQWTFQVTARDDRDACAQAAQEFRETERLSGVGWVRQILRSTCSAEGMLMTVLLDDRQTGVER